MKWPAYKSFNKYLFICIFIFFIARTNFYIDIEKNIFQFNLKNWFSFSIDFFSIVVLIFLLIYLLYLIAINKKFPITLILLLYPINGFLGYLYNTELHNNTFVIWHHFITLNSAILFYIILDCYKIFNRKFFELLFKVFISIIIIYFLLRIFPLIVYKLYNNIDLRITHKDNIFQENILHISNIFLTQNVNGQARLLFILQLFFLIFFKKNIYQKKIISNILFLFSLSLLLIILLMESRFIILASCVSFFFIILSANNLKLIKKIFYLLFFIATIVFSMTLDKYQRFLEFDESTILNDKINVLNDKINVLNDKYSSSYNKKMCSTNIDINKIDAVLSGRLCGWEILIKKIENKDLFFGKGFFADQILLKAIQKTSSNSWINILFNTGILSLVIILSFIIIFLFKFIKFQNINNKNIYLCLSHYLLIFTLCRSLLEDTIVFLNIDLIIFIISLLLIKNSHQKIKSEIL
jgi:hypothetical protein